LFTGYIVERRGDSVSEIIKALEPAARGAFLAGNEEDLDYLLLAPADRRFVSLEKRTNDFRRQGEKERASW